MSPGRGAFAGGRGVSPRAARRILGLLIGSALLGCVPPRGGWDVAALRDREPWIGRAAGERIGDLVPHPAPVDGQLALVVCRFPSGRPVSVHGAGVGWPAERAAVAVEAIDRAVEGLELVLAEEAGAGAGPEAASAGIGVRSLADAAGPGPLGLGDTLSECDVSRRGAGAGARLRESDEPVRGTLRRAWIRMRLARFDVIGRPRPASDAEWIGALMHELGHAVGFPSHVAFGFSPVGREEGRLRLLGERALAGEAIEAPTLAALYRLSPGTRLGTAPLDARGEAVLADWLARVAAQRARAGAGQGPFSTVGGRSARLVWRWSDGVAIELRFPDWTRELQAGAPITIEGRTRGSAPSRVGGTR